MSVLRLRATRPGRAPLTACVRPEDVKGRRSSIQWLRKLFHASMGTAILVGYGATGLERLPAIFIMVVVSAIVVSVDLIRLWIPSLNQRCMKDFLPLMRKDEIQGPSAMVAFTLGATLAILLFPKAVALLGVAYLAYGDPIASIVGIRWGRLRIGKKSLEGSLACFGLGTLVSVPILWIFAPGLASHLWLAAMLGGMSGAAAEFAPSGKLDDNFVLPILSGAIFLGALGLMGWPLA